ncbi:6-phospho-beta-glucosidase [Devosia rhodophyticola]|uniref:6-phospho-beta-glucosidase n=1 Tax=Devosia rhodophyticola TaxID=3026423 RepID=A0ABY7Z1E5_9HYPH|nr:6-phospho-beta-glucosidase [Devosia rhodophyticola]WDR06825.1 6-phospho-beta-glucosidase [Devosia rhodophyticola]
MKLTLIGGGGVRAPLFVQSALRRAQKIGLNEICLMDTDQAQLDTFGSLCRHLARRGGSPVTISTTTDVNVALQGAQFVVTTIRPGGIDGRITDEDIALKHGVLGQETTGAGGFAMALRSIPVILQYAEIMAQICPDAWLLNFTNPAGLVTQALRNAGYSHSVGICDSANGAQNAVAAWFGVDPQSVAADLFGLNHLSFSRTVMIEGRNVLSELLANDDFLNTSSLNVFEPDVVRIHNMWINEYLYYYYYADKALTAQRSGGARGREIKALNAELDQQLAAIDLESDPDGALQVYFNYENRRSGSYMKSAWQDRSNLAAHAAKAEPDGEGYAGVALDIIAALSGGPEFYTGLNVPNGDTITDLRPDDVVEVMCRIDRNGIHPKPVGTMPEGQSCLVQSVKRYERLTVEAVATRSRTLAVEALVAHPLVQTYSRAKLLVADYLDAHSAYTKGWS